MKYSKLFLTFLFIFGFTLTNCEKKEESCPPFKGEFFDINGIESLIHHYSYTETSSPPLENNSVLPFEDYSRLILRYSVSYLSSLNQPKKTIGLGQLYALSCNFSGESGSKHEKYQNITIITLNDFNDQYKKGDTINDLMRVGYEESIEEFISSRDTSNVEWANLSFGLTQPPSINPKFQVKVIIELSTGEIYSKESTTVEFEN